MLRSLKDLLGFKIKTTDDWTGPIEDFYLEKTTWKVLHIVTGEGWLSLKKVLLPPGITGRPDQGGDAFPPPAEGPFLPLALPRKWMKKAEKAEEAEHLLEHDPALFSLRRVLGCDLIAKDGPAGILDDCIADTNTWSVRWLVIDLKKILPDGKVMASASQVIEVDEEERRVRLDLLTEQVQRAPGYDAGTPVNRELEERLYDYYGRPRPGSKGRL